MPAPPEDPRPLAAKPKLVRVVVVEDQDVLQDLLLTVFARAGFETTIAGTVAEAMVLLQPPPDYLTLDLHLPDGRGTEILRRIRDEGMAVKVALTTGSIDTHLLAVARALRPDVIFQKPYNAGDIVKWINSTKGE